MHIHQHVIITFILGIILYPFIGLYSLVVFLSGFLFDIDHYFYYVLKKRDFSLKNSYLYCLQGNEVSEYHMDVLHIFHIVEFWILLLILGFLIHKIFLFVFIGLVFHMILDLINLVKIDALGVRAWSLIGWLKRH